MGQKLSWLHPSCSSSNDEEEKEEGSETCWADLPKDILELVLPNLLGADYSNFRGTCTSWQKASTFFPPPYSSALSRFPYLMTLDLEDTSSCKFFQPLNNTTYYHCEEDLEGAKVWRSSWGWLLISRGYDVAFFFNPSTKEKIKLPNLPDYLGNSIADGFFSSPPTSSECTVILFIEFGSTSIEFGMIRRGDAEWTIKKLESSGDKDFSLSSDGIVFSNGKLYCWGAAGDIARLDFGVKSGVEMTWEILTEPLFSLPDYNIRKMFAVKCDGGMLVVIITGQERTVQVKRCNLPEMVWAEEDVNNLGDEALYLSHGGSFLVKAPNLSMSNKIYFPMFYGKNGVFYSLETQKYHSIAGDYSSEAWYRFQSPQAISHWIHLSPDESALHPDFVW